MSLLSAMLAYLAGALSVLSPCVLPLLPLVLSGGVAKHPLAPLALAGGVAVSFSVIGLFGATIGYTIGIDNDFIRRAGGAALSLIGVVLMTPTVRPEFARAHGSIEVWASNRLKSVHSSGLADQASVGILLGAVWSPCVGPTLGAALLLAAQGRDLVGVGSVMFAFGFGAASLLLALGHVSARALRRLRGRMRDTETLGRVALGGALVLVGLSVVTGADRVFDAFLVEISPVWLTSIATKY